MNLRMDLMSQQQSTFIRTWFDFDAIKSRSGYAPKQQD
jgi:hypothetical protein